MLTNTQVDEIIDLRFQNDMIDKHKEFITTLSDVLPSSANSAAAVPGIVRRGCDSVTLDELKINLNSYHASPRHHEACGETCAYSAEINQWLEKARTQTGRDIVRLAYLARELKEEHGCLPTTGQGFFNPTSGGYAAATASGKSLATTNQRARTSGWR